MFKIRLALCLMLTMAFNLFPMGPSPVMASSTAEERGDRRLYVEDFSGFEEGTTFTGTGTYRLDNVVIVIEGQDDSVQIATDSVSGKKSLKVVKTDNEKAIDIRYEFPEEFDSGVIEASFDARLETNSIQSNYWPAIYDSVNATLGKGIVTGGDSWWIGYTSVPTKEEPDKPNNWIDTLDASSENSYTTYQAIVDLTANNYKLNKKKGEVNKSSEARDISDAVMTSIGITIDANADQQNDGIYWIGGFSVGEQSAILSVDFDNCELGTKVYVGGSSGRQWHDNFKNWSLGIDGETSNVSVQDDGTGKKALKIVIGKTNGDTQIQYKIPEIKSGKTIVTFTAKLENHTRKLSEWPALAKNNPWAEFGSSNMTDAAYNIKPRTSGQSEWIATFTEHKSKFLEGYSKFISTGTFGAGDEGYTTEAYYPDGIRIGKKSTKAGDITSFDTIAFRFLGTVGSDSSAGIYWIGSIDVETLALKITGASVAHKATNVLVNRPLEVYFNHEIKEAELTSDYFKLYEDGVQLEASDYSLAIDSTDKTKVSITPTNNLLAPNTEYTLRVEPGITTHDADEIPLKAGLTRKFTTSTDDDFALNNISIEDSSATGKLDVSASLVNQSLSDNADYFLVVAAFEKDTEGNEYIIDARSESGVLDATATNPLSTVLQKPTGEDGKVRFYIWRSSEDLFPLSRIIVKDVPQPPSAL